MKICKSIKPPSQNMLDIIRQVIYISHFIIIIKRVLRVFHMKVLFLNCVLMLVWWGALLKVMCVYILINILCFGLFLSSKGGVLLQNFLSFLVIWTCKKYLNIYHLTIPQYTSFCHVLLGILVLIECRVIIH